MDIEGSALEQVKARGASGIAASPLTLEDLFVGLFSLFFAVAARSGPVRSANYGLGIWTMLVVMGNLTRDFFFISRAFRGGLPSMGLSEAFWPAALAGLLLALVGYLALWSSLVMHTPYRPVLQSERGS